MGRRSKFSPEVRERAVRLVILWRRSVERTSVRAPRRARVTCCTALAVCLLVVTTLARAEAQIVGVRWCGGGAFAVRYISRSSGWVRFGPGASVEGSTEGSLTVSTRAVGGAVVAEWIDGNKMVGMTVVFVPSPGPVVPPPIAHLKDVALLITDLSNYARAVRLIRAVHPRTAIIASTAKGVDQFVDAYPKVIRATGNEFSDVLTGWRVAPIVVPGPIVVVPCDATPSELAVASARIAGSSLPRPAATPTGPRPAATRTEPSHQQEQPTIRCGCVVHGRGGGRDLSSVFAALAVAVARRRKRWRALRGRGSDRRRPRRLASDPPGTLAALAFARKQPPPPARALAGRALSAGKSSSVPASDSCVIPATAPFRDLVISIARSRWHR